MPVETNSMGREGTRSLGLRPSVAASAARLNGAREKRAGFWVMVTRTGRPLWNVNSTGRIPAPVCCRMCTLPSEAGTTPSSASRNQVPMTGCPASGSSWVVVKMRRRASARLLVGRWMKTVSDKFISRAMACIFLVERPSPSVTTASGLPAKGLVVKTSMVYKRRFMIGLRGRKGMGKSNALQFGARPVAGHVSGIESGFGFEEYEMDFFVGDRQMFYAFGHDYEFAGTDGAFAIAETHAQGSGDDQEHFIFVIVVMP